MYVISLTLICLGFFENKSCSLLSRLKNRYEYIPQENSVNEFTEDLYDFEFTNIYSIKTSLLDMLNDNDITEKKLYYISHNKKLNTSYSENGVYTYKWTTIAIVATDSLFILRPTLNTSLSTSSRPRKTWPSYFPRKTLTFPSMSGSSWISSTNIKTPAKKIESSLPYPWIFVNSQSQETPTPTSFAPPITSQMITSTTSSNITTGETPLMSPSATADKNSTKKTSKMTSKSKKAYCYRCGLNETRIPMPYCYYTFEGDDQRYSRRKYRFKVKCITSSKTKEVKNVVYGPFRGGCFKRFLDVGIEYNERGCRTLEPTKGNSFASVRLAKMEKLLHHLKNGCVFSPHASITPFSRAISLYARYHVCVCSQKYCNRAANTNTCKIYKHFLFILCVIFKAHFLEVIL